MFGYDSFARDVHHFTTLLSHVLFVILRITMYLPRKVLVLAFFLFQPASGWWTFWSSSTEGTGEERGDHLKNSPVPFEMTTAEEKFLAEAKKYMGDLTPLDSCHQLVSIFNIFTLLDYIPINIKQFDCDLDISAPSSTITHINLPVHQYSVWFFFTDTSKTWKSGHYFVDNRTLLPTNYNRIDSVTRSRVRCWR